MLRYRHWQISKLKAFTLVPLALMPYFARTDKTLCPDTILWLEGEGNYTRIHFQEQPSSVMAYTLKRFEEHFAGFVRVRRDVLVNPRYIQYIRWNGQPKLTIYLSDGTVLTASRRRHRLLAAQLRQQKSFS